MPEPRPHPPAHIALRGSRWSRPVCRSVVVAAFLLLTSPAPASTSATFPKVEVEDKVYEFQSADNGAGPMWCHGSTCIVRSGEVVFATGLETLADARPLNNCRWMLFRRDEQGWSKVWVDESERTREPSPVVTFNNRVFVSANPTLVPDRSVYSGRSRPEILEFSTQVGKGPMRQWTPRWSGEPRFTEHSYRSFAADQTNTDLILFQNVGDTHAEWAFLDRTGSWTAAGRLEWPWGAEYAKPEPVRVCYPNVAVRDRAVYFCGVSDIVEPNPAWRAYKKELTGREWDYDFRRLFYTWCPDITAGKFQPWVEIASRETTAGWITPGDLWVDASGNVHLLWTERAIDERLRPKFFPEAKQRHALEYAMVRAGQVLHRRTVLATEEGEHELAGRGRFHVTPDHRLWVLYYVSGTTPTGDPISENRLVEILPGSSVSPAVRIALQRPFTDFFTANIRAGSPPSNVIDLLGIQAGRPEAIAYARVRLLP